MMSGQQRHFLARFLRDERGTTAIEYAFIASGIALVLVLAAPPIGDAVSAIFDLVAAGF